MFALIMEYSHESTEFNIDGEHGQTFPFNDGLVEAIRAFIRRSNDTVTILLPRLETLIASLFEKDVDGFRNFEKVAQLSTECFSELVELVSNSQESVRIVFNNQLVDMPNELVQTINSLHDKNSSEFSPSSLIASKYLIATNSSLHDAVVELLTIEGKAKPTFDRDFFAFLSQLNLDAKSGLMSVHASQPHKVEVMVEQVDLLNRQIVNSKRDVEKLKKQMCELNEENALTVRHLHFTQELYEKALDNVEQIKFETKKQETRATRLSVAEASNSDTSITRHDSRYSMWLLSSLQKAHALLWTKSRSFRKRLTAQAEEIEKCEFFSADEYKKTYIDVGQSKLKPELHYLLYGAYECRDPSRQFNTLAYVEKYVDVAKSGAHPLVHFIKYGCVENRVTTHSKIVEK